jgi:hypothetical protein
VAVLVVAELTAGAVYATVTALPLPIADANVSCTVVPDIATELTVTALEFAVTANALAKGAVVPNVSLYVNVRVKPLAASAEELYTGAV